MNASVPKERVDEAVAELAKLMRVIHNCGYNTSCGDETDTCVKGAARAVLARLGDMGLLQWGDAAAVEPTPSLPGGVADLYALRLSAEFWRPVGERTPEEVEAGIRNYHWLPVVLATRAGYQARPELAARTFLSSLTKEQVGHLVPTLRAVLDELDPPDASEAAMSMYALQEMCDDVRARLMYDRSRGVTTDDATAWTHLGWDVGQREGVGLRHPSEAVNKIFYAPAWRPNLDELAWFRDGFARQREGSPRLTTRG